MRRVLTAMIFSAIAAAPFSILGRAAYAGEPHAEEGIKHAKDITHIRESMKHLEETLKATKNPHAKEAITHAKEAVKHAEQAAKQPPDCCQSAQAKPAEKRPFKNQRGLNGKPFRPLFYCAISSIC